VLLLAGTLRLAHLEQVQFKLDEVKHLEAAQRLASGQELPLAGSSSSVGLAKPALFTWLLALPALLGRDPRLAAGFIALLNTAAAGGLFWVNRHYFGRLASLLASLLYAVNPWAVLYARDIFTADILAPFCLLLWWGLLHWLAEGRPGGVVIALGALGALFAITFSPWPLALVTLVLLLTNLRRLGWRELLIGLGVALALLAPWLYYQVRGGLAEVASLLARVTAGGGAGGERSAWWITFRYAFWLHSGLNFAALAGPSYLEFRPLPGWLALANYLLAALFGGGLLLAALRGIRSLARRDDARSAAPWRVLALWLWLPLLGMSLQPAELQVHYLVILFPAGALALGLAAEWLARRLVGLFKGAMRRIAIGVLSAGLVFILASQASISFYLADFVQSHPTSYGIPLSSWLRLTEQATELARAAGTDELWVTAAGSDPAIATEPAVLSYLLAGEVRPLFNGQGGHEGLLLPADRPGLYLLTSMPARSTAALERLQATTLAEIELPDGRTARFLYSVPYSGPALQQKLGYTPLAFTSDFIQLVGYEWPDDALPGATASLAEYWRFLEVSDEVRGAQHSAYNQLYYADGRKAAQDDGFSLPEADWRPGHLLVQWFDLALPADLPPGDYMLLTGLYRLSDGARVQWQGAGDALSLGPLRVGVAE